MRNRSEGASRPDSGLGAIRRLDLIEPSVRREPAMESLFRGLARHFSTARHPGRIHILPPSLTTAYEAIFGATSRSINLALRR